VGTPHPGRFGTNRAEAGEYAAFAKNESAKERARLIAEMEGPLSPVFLYVIATDRFADAFVLY
jgi:hypothetical protein